MVAETIYMLGIAFCVILILWIAIRSLTLIGGANVVQFTKKKTQLGELQRVALVKS